MTIKNRIDTQHIDYSGILGCIDMVDDRVKGEFMALPETLRKLAGVENVLVFYTVDFYPSSGKFNYDLHVKEFHLDLVYGEEEEHSEHIKITEGKHWEFFSKKYTYFEDDEKIYNNDHYIVGCELDFEKKIGVFYAT